MDGVDPQRLAEFCAERRWAGDRASQALGMRIESVGSGHSVITMTVREDMLNGHDRCHGGYIFTLADSAFAFACNTYGRVTVAQGAGIDFVRPARLGDVLRAEARELSRGGRTGVYDVEVHRGDGKLIACFRGNSFTTDESMTGDRDS
ncbi:MAG: hydroxyphenylacetyl-CoA thioesterase PaaI [Gammaproteobacteria bacterium]|jgi:acyl-CoA thioesterase|nr:hydroxyphenylacetyl-CoA thioesterase PaaI [Gammaproteobacteria bacterium]MBP6050744.1 hydroxyphenylacetyl-CoA thioesterase PaaI [Pseudomonadales bacterium]MBK6584466.1 hydroxyphenylacetyl-CoA thioesterase PaaI [Gammaproteobacteria bacterium]MBK7168296.1 hydroxyphenylacetyl-CoA thioesterase PaaI [Gammaproteobacteria bacterium]MBK7520924.1 hydroxyphenylacetyl-CoA thioesterase PaaI [Gammaproteobacteria bacterium]